MRLLIAGQKYFGASVLEALRGVEGVTVAHVAAPAGDRLHNAAIRHGVPVIASGLREATMPDGVDLIVAAHSHDFIGEKTRLRARFGGIGYHPSLLPLHRGKDAVRWAVHMRDRVTGGTVYQLSNRVDGGNVLSQQHVFIRPGVSAADLWREELAPLGVRQFVEVVARFRDSGFQHGTRQREALATWEPSFDRPPVFRPDLILLPHIRDKAP